MDEFEEYDEFSKRMEDRFPKMFEEKYGGFAVGKGWWPLLETLCDAINSHTIWRTKKTDAEPIPQVVVEQVKEKFGSLRFYYRGGDEYINGLTSMAEQMSSHMCEDCGAPGKIHGGGWLKVLCDKHEADREERRRQYMKQEGLEE